MKKILVGVLCASLLLLVGVTRFPQALDGVMGAAVASAKSISELYTRFANARQTGTPKVNILVVPGHEPKYGGAEYNNLKERDLVLKIGDHLTTYLKTEPAFTVMQSRNTVGWNPILSKYFTDNWNDIITWRAKHVKERAALIAVGKYTIRETVQHNTAASAVSVRLHGINKWSNENDIDIAIHLHINDNPRSNTSIPGKYSGFTIYVPDGQHLNGTTTRALAEAIKKRLALHYPVSNLPGERAGVVDSQDLIAIGSYNSASAASMLIEYGYIYEKQFTDPAEREIILKDLAYQTHLGIQDFFKNAQTN